MKKSIRKFLLSTLLIATTCTTMNTGFTTCKGTNIVKADEIAVAPTIAPTMQQTDIVPTLIPTQNPTIVPTLIPTDQIPTSSNAVPATPIGWAQFKDPLMYNKETPGTLSFMCQYVVAGRREFLLDGKMIGRNNYTEQNMGNYQLVTLNQSVLDPLTYGLHKISIQFNNNNGYVTVDNDLYVVACEPKEDFKPAYEVKETSCFTSSGIAYNMSMDDDFYLNFDNSEAITEILVDGTQIARSGYQIGKNYLCIKNRVVHLLESGMHHMEVVYGDKEDVINIYVEQKHPGVTGGPTVAPSKPIITTEAKIDKQVNSVHQSYSLKYEGGVKDFDLSKLTLRLYYSSDNPMIEEFACDNAAVQFNRAPYYLPCTDSVTGTFHDGYLEIGFSKDIDITDGTLTIQARCNKKDWSEYKNYITEHLYVLYNGSIVKKII